MQLPHPSSSSQALTKFGLYTAVRLEAQEETKSFSVLIRKGISAVKSCKVISEEKEDDSEASLALRDAQENNLNNIITALSLDILSETKNDRTHKRHKNIFLNPASEITALPLEEKLDYVEQMEKRLKAEPHDKLYQKHHALLKHAHTETKKASDAHKKNLNTEQTALDKEKMSEEALRTALNTIYGKLIAHFANKKEAESFFKKHIYSKKKKADAVVASTAPPPAN